MMNAQIEEGLQSVERYLRQMTASDVALLEDAGRHIALSGGKRIRPRLVLMAYQAAGGVELATAVPLAAAVELVHTATLVHDDINDHSDTRRGRATVHTVWDRTFALLTGDYLFAKVYQMMSHYAPQLNQIMSDACVQLVEGETLQAAAAKSGAMDRETYKRIIERKTASLFAAGARMGSLLAGADAAVVAALGDYGRYLGLTFQIVDDILDIVGDPETMGKPVGSDLAQGRGVLAAENGRRAPHDVATAVQAPSPDPVATMLADLKASGAVEVARAQAEEMAHRARAALEPLADLPARAELLALVDQTLDRHN